MSVKISINQLGYLLNEEKYFVTNSKSDDFYLTDLLGSRLNIKISMICFESDSSTGENLYRYYFSDLKTKGEYYINSQKFNINMKIAILNNIYNNVYSTTLNSYYFQRCGCTLDASRVGEFKRGACHHNKLSYHPSTGLSGKKDVTGGWHDAGDYGRYVTPASVTLGCMLLGYENFKNQFDSYFIEEVKYELDWLLKMQETSEISKMYGATHYMINSREYTWSEPTKDKAEQFIFDYCSRATADFCAITALCIKNF
jgi:endoglucanase